MIHLQCAQVRHVLTGVTQFLPAIRKWNEPCLPLLLAAKHHHTLAGTHFPSRWRYEAELACVARLHSEVVTHPSTVLTGSAVDNFVDAANNVTVRPNRHSMTEGIKHQTSDQSVVLALCVVWSPKPLKTLWSSKCDVTIVYTPTVPHSLYHRHQCSFQTSLGKIYHTKREYTPKIVDITQRCSEAICRGHSASEPAGGANTTFCRLYSRMGRYPSSQYHFSLHQGSRRHQTSLPWVTSVWIYALSASPLPGKHDVINKTGSN